TQARLFGRGQESVVSDVACEERLPPNRKRFGEQLSASARAEPREQHTAIVPAARTRTGYPEWDPRRQSAEVHSCALCASATLTADIISRKCPTATSSFTAAT